MFIFKNEGLKGILKKLKVITKKIFKRYILFKSKIQDYKVYQELFLNKSGLEIGGPSSIFTKNGKLPLYPVIKNLDNCNFTNNTIWQGHIKQGKNYRYEKDKLGYQFICEGTNLSKIVSESYDFVISSNVLEHIANPLKAIKEWLRIIKINGILLLIIPNKNDNFDHNRPLTSFNHLILDFENDIQEDDLTHIDEILKLHDLSKDPPAGNFEQFKKRSLKNYENRTLHHHVFDLRLLQKIYKFFNLKILLMNDIESDFIIVGAKRYPSF